jgi:hypothetical protein
MNQRLEKSLRLFWASLEFRGYTGQLLQLALRWIALAEGEEVPQLATERRRVSGR